MREPYAYRTPAGGCDDQCLYRSLASRNWHVYGSAVHTSVWLDYDVYESHGMDSIAFSYMSPPGCGSACRLCHVPLVSRRFSEACRDPNMWPDLHVLHASFGTEAGWQSFLRWLAVRASGLHTLVFGHDNCWVRT